MLSLKNIGGLLLLWAFLLPLTILVFGAVPKTWVGAALLVFAGPLALFVGEALRELVIGALSRVPPVAIVNDWAQRNSKGKQISALRIGVALTWVLIAGVAMGGAVFLMDGTIMARSIDSVAAFWSRHFR